MTRWLTGLAGVMGAAGVAASAYGAHAGGENVATAGLFLLLHAGVGVAIGLHAPGGRAYTIAGGVLLAGTALFAGALMTRAVFDLAAPAGTAPLGGMLMMAGWLGIAVAALLTRR